MTNSGAGWLLMLAIVVLGGASTALASKLRITRRQLRAVLASAGEGRTVGSEPMAPPSAAAGNPEATDRRDQALLSGAFDVHGDGVMVVDADAKPVLVNAEGERYRDARYSDVLAQDAVQELLRRALQGERGESELSLFGPPQRVLSLVAGPIRDADEIVGAAAVIRDVTEARRTDMIRRDFVAAVSHELKTPIGALSLLAETMSASDDAQVVVQLADRIGQEAERLSQIIDDLLDLSIVESQDRPRREPAALHLLVQDAYEQVRSSADAAGVPIVISPIDASLDLECDRGQLVSAIRNLLDNAVKYSETGAPVEVSAGPADGSVTIAVRDHGIGIPRHDLERVFERFYRVDRARSRATGGTGLGLAIVRHVAVAHGGDVTADSVEGEGSVFCLTLPRFVESRLFRAS